MQIRILTIGKVREKYIQLGNKEFIRRLKPYCRLEVVAVAEEKLRENLSPREEEQVVVREGQRLHKALKPGEYVVALDPQGKQVSSEELARHLSRLGLRGRSSIAVLIGGPLGLCPLVKKRADLVLSLSPLTFTHEMTQLILLEQLYRAFRIMRGEPYHR